MTLANELYLPQPIQAYIAKYEQHSGQNNEYSQKSQRMREYWASSYENGESINRQWRILEKYAINEEKLISLFMVLPNQINRQPLRNLYYERSRSPQQERQDLDELIKSVQNIQRFFRTSHFVHWHPPNYRYVLADVSASTRHYRKLKKIPRHYYVLKWIPNTNTKDCYQICQEFREIEIPFKQGLFKLERLLKAVDPSAKYLSRQRDSPDMEKHVYVMQLATLNQYLTKPKHAAIAVIANANIPDVPVSEESIRKAYERRTNYPQFFS